MNADGSWLTQTQTAVLASLDESGPLVGRAIALRQDIHAHPELARQEKRTSQLIIDSLHQAGVTARTVSGTGVIADLGSPTATRRVALRADLDALPLPERTDLPFASTVDGLAHACGHDVHTSAAWAATLALAEVDADLRTADLAIRVIFQPAEEAMPGGALDLLPLGVLESVDSILALHCDPSIDLGQIGLRTGALTAAADRISVTVTGSGGHTSRPHLTEDVTYALAAIVTQTSAVLSRRVDPRAGLSVIWGHLNAGSAGNVIPESGLAAGTIRLLDSTLWEGVGELVTGIIEEIAAPYQVGVQVRHIKGVPAVFNEPAAVGFLAGAVADLSLEQVLAPQSLGGEDFAWMTQEVPGAMARLGTRTPGGTTYDLHQGDLVIDDSAVGIGARVLAVAALRALAAPTLP